MNEQQNTQPESDPTINDLASHIGRLVEIIRTHDKIIYRTTDLEIMLAESATRLAEKSKTL